MEGNGFDNYTCIRYDGIKGTVSKNKLKNVLKA